MSLTKATYSMIEGAPVNVLDYGAVGDGVTNDTAAIQAAINYVVATGESGCVYFPAKTFKCNSGLTLDRAYVGLYFAGGKLDFSGMTTGTALTITGSVNPPWTQSQNSITGLNMVGPGKASTVDGVVFDTPVSSGEGSSHCAIYDHSISEFRRGLTFNSRAYLIFLYSGDTFSCTTGIYAPSGATDGGENISFIGGATYDCNLAVQASNGNGELHFESHSLDYNVKQIAIDGSKVFFSHGHIEAGDYPATPCTIVGNGGFLVIKNSWLVDTDLLPHTYAQMFDVSVEGSLVIDGCFANNMLTTSGAWATGAGNVQITNLQSYTAHQNPYLQHTTRSRLRNGYFDLAIGTDNLFITEDGAAITSRTNGQNIDLAISGGKLVATKNFGVGSPGSFAWAVSVRPGEQLGARLYYDKPGSETGTMFIAFIWAALDQSGAVPTIQTSETAGVISVPFTSSPVTSTAAILGGSSIFRAPEWAQFALVQVALGSCDAGTYNFDAVQIDRCG